ncbi:MAG: hypothetical protein PHS77_11390 [Gallionellaceae bacterium]|nr:hypothetical protein [Gallionellaceae bacterium]
MPNWQSTPPSGDTGQPLRIIRTPADRPFAAIITCTEPTGCCTHFVGNRTVPCEGVDVCPWCQDGHPWRWHGYVSCVSGATLEHVIFEFTATASDTFRTYAQSFGGLRGCHFQAHRPSKRHNGRVVIACKPADLGRITLPEPPNLKKLLCNLWGIQYTEADTHRLPNRIGAQIGVGPGNGDARNKP